MVEDSDDAETTTPETWKALAGKYADLAAECLKERKVTNLHLDVIARRLGFAPKTYPILVAVVVCLLCLRLLDLVHRFSP
jgi:hypothetical protein